MFTNLIFVHTVLGCFLRTETMANGKSRIMHKHLRLDAIKLKRAQKVLAATTETEAVERALDLAISEYERNRLAAEANQKFIKSGVVIRDVFASLGK